MILYFYNTSAAVVGGGGGARRVERSRLRRHIRYRRTVHRRRRANSVHTRCMPSDRVSPPPSRCSLSPSAGRRRPPTPRSVATAVRSRLAGTETGRSTRSRRSASGRAATTGQPCRSGSAVRRAGRTTRTCGSADRRARTAPSTGSG